MIEMVYVVDDDEAVRDSLRWLLEANGFRVTSLESAERFLASLPKLSNQIACLILDVRMPGMTGTELHEELLERGLRIPLIFITGHGNVPLAVDSMKKGAVDFLEKPFNDEQLCALVAKAFQQLRDARKKPMARNAPRSSLPG
jgi:two-component system, LuxR family, response regulator TtrR